MKKRQEQLIQAIVANDAFRVQALLSEDPGLAGARDPEGRTPILLSLYFGHEELARLVAERATEVDLFESAALGEMEALRRHLAQSTASANAVAPDGFGPLGLAVFFGRLEAAEALLDAGADPNTPASNASRVRPIHSAAAHRDPERSLDLCRVLLERGASPNVAQAGGWTPLHQAAAHGRVAVAELLLAHGASKEAVSEDDRTPLQMAEAKGHAEIQALLGGPGG
ncbi:MAG: ankyrin repeat domain-containing protein [Longimicrobiales bacterium]